MVFGLFGLMAMSCKNSEKKNDAARSVDESTEIPATDNNVPDMHTSKIALDWEGTYEGTLPCASCEGIETKVSLKADGNYSLEIEYLGEKDGKLSENGKFEWNEDGNTITLQEADGGKRMYKVVENAIIFLDSNGEINTGELADHYVLSKK